MEKLPFQLFSCQHGDENSMPHHVVWTFQGVYLHNNLKTAVDYDLVFIDEENEAKFFNQEIPEGIYLVDVVDSTNDVVYNNCIFYLWYFPNKRVKDHWYRGLICLPNDEWGNYDAKNKYDERTMGL